MPRCAHAYVRIESTERHSTRRWHAICSSTLPAPCNRDETGTAEDESTCACPGPHAEPALERGVLWGKVIDNRRCIGCHACTVACKQEHSVPIGVTRTYVKQVEVGRFPDVSRHFQVTRCNQCSDPPCVNICPTGAMYQRPDGIVDFDRSACIGCQACIAACPYDAIYIDPVSNSAEKCNFCSHRVDAGLQPACVAVCPTQAIIVGDLNDPDSEIASIVTEHEVKVRKPEKRTDPKLFYVNGQASALDPSAASFGGMYPSVERQASSVAPGRPSNTGINGDRMPRPAESPGETAAAAILAYDNRHSAPWNWKVSAYTWTKSVAAGAVMVSAALGIAGRPLDRADELGVLGIAGLFLLMTVVLLVLDLSHPRRFFFTLTRPRWGSWVTRGAWIIGLFGAYIPAHAFMLAADFEGAAQVLRWVGAPLGAAAGAYTAFLFIQAKGRDLWQDHALPIHFLVRTALAGSAALVIVALIFGSSTPGIDLAHWILVGTLAGHLALLAGHLHTGRLSTDGRTAARNLTVGRFRTHFWSAAIAGTAAPMVLAAAFPSTGPVQAAAAILALTGLAAYEHAFVQAGQSVPLS